ncbi:class I SAM-dependent methyltransferase [Streptomyces sp. NBC_01613]|uniref:class I SAM-dependent methyltransferase n=1 Tax=Streptomyces sp. NBC_01613 TaxID=2975896 RepID=UPI003865BCBD
MSHVDENARTRKIWARDAPKYDDWMRHYDRHMVRDGRQWLCSQARGHVLEVAVGTGPNLSNYPPGTDLTAVDLSLDMLDRARRRAESLSIKVTFNEASATELPFTDDHFDTVVSALALCCIPDDRAAVAEMYRVLKPGGVLLLLDHVISHRFAVRMAQRALDPLLVKQFNDHQLRRPLHLAREAGFTIRRRERYCLGMIERFAADKPAA